MFAYKNLSTTKLRDKYNSTMLSLATPPPDSASDIDIESIKSLDRLYYEPTPSINNNDATAIKKHKHSKCYYCSMCLLCIFVTIIGVAACILIYLRVQSNQEIHPTDTPSTKIELSLNMMTNTSLNQLISHKLQIATIIQQSADQISP